MNQTGTALWAEDAYKEYRQHRGAFGPIMEKEVEAAFYFALSKGVQHENMRLRDSTACFGPPPWKVEDAFEVWREHHFEGIEPPVKIRERNLKSAFLAGAEYGAAAGSEPIHDSENRPGAPSWGRGASVGAICDGCAEPFATPSRFCFICYQTAREAASLPLGDTGGPIPSRSEWKLERCRVLIFAILGGLTAKPRPTGHLGDDMAAFQARHNNVTSVCAWIKELGELWETM